MKCNQNCGDSIVIAVATPDYQKWRTGKSTVKDCFPYLKKEEREYLVVGVCSNCYDEMLDGD